MMYVLCAHMYDSVVRIKQCNTHNQKKDFAQWTFIVYVYQTNIKYKKYKKIIHFFFILCFFHVVDVYSEYNEIKIKQNNWNELSSWKIEITIQDVVFLVVFVVVVCLRALFSSSFHIFRLGFYCKKKEKKRILICL